MGLKKKLAILKYPYPYYYHGRSLLWIMAIIFTLGLAFNYFFRPFNVELSEHKFDYIWICVFHSIVPVIVLLLLYLFFLHRLKNEEKWTIGKELLFLYFFILLIGVGQFLIRDLIYDNPYNWSLGYLLEEVRNSFLVGTLLLGLIISLNFNRLNSQYIKKAHELGFSPKKLEQNDQNTIIPISTQLKSDDFDLSLGHFIFAKSEGNYVEFYLWNSDRLQKSVKRISIKDLNAQLGSFPNVIRTHRSYLVNLAHLKNIKGNAQGYQLQLSNCEEEVPVSRNNIQRFEMALKPP